MGKKGYYIQIVKYEGKYRFEFYYRGKAFMGYSEQYNSENECLKGYNNLRNFILNNNVENYNIIRRLDEKYKYSYRIHDKNKVLYYGRNVENKTNREKNLHSTWKNIVDCNIKKVKEK